MRKSYNGLAGILNSQHKWKLRSGDGFVFINRRRTMMKILIWDRSGFVIYQKKLDRGTFEFPKLGEKELTVTMSMLMLEGIKISSVQTLPIPFVDRIERLNWLMRGWVNYFKHATGYEKLKYLDNWTRCRLRYCIWKDWKNPKRRYRAFRQLGLSHSKARQFCYSRLGGWRIACSPIKGTTVTEARLKQRGYQSFSSYYHKVRSQMT